MSPEMGHRSRLDDIDEVGAVEAICTTTLELAVEDVYPGNVGFRKDSPNRRIRAVLFETLFRVQTDRLGSEPHAKTRTMIVVQFSAQGQAVTADSWSLWVRGDWPERTDRLGDESS